MNSKNRVKFNVVFYLFVTWFSNCVFATNLPTLKITKDEMVEDLHFFANELPKRHINAFSKISKYQFQHEVELLILRQDELSIFMLTAEMMRIANMVGDGHTGVSWQNLTELYPFEISVYGNRYFITGVKSEYRQYLGYEITHIGNTPIREVADLVSPYLTAVENKWSKMHRVTIFIMMARLLHELDVTPSPRSTYLIIKSEHEEKSLLEVSSISEDDYFDNNWLRIKPKEGYLIKSKNQHLEGLWFNEISKIRALYIRFDKYPSMKEMQNFGEEAARVIETKRLERVVIDLRNNKGGDFYVGIELSRQLTLLDNLDWLDGIYVITGRKTFSAAMSNAAQYKQMLNAKIIGEPTGANPIGFQELGSFELPNSKRIVYFSKRLFRFQQENSQGVQPDVFIPRDWLKEKQGLDPAVEWLVKHWGSDNSKAF